MAEHVRPIVAPACPRPPCGFECLRRIAYNGHPLEDWVTFWPATRQKCRVADEDVELYSQVSPRLQRGGDTRYLFQCFFVRSRARNYERPTVAEAREDFPRRYKIDRHADTISRDLFIAASDRLTDVRVEAMQLAHA